MAENQSDAVRVTARILPEGTTERDFGITLYLHRTTTVATERDEAEFIRSAARYATSNAVEAADGVPQSVIDAAKVYFQQDPYPHHLQIGTVIAAAQPSFIFGADDRSVTDIEALGNGTALTFNGNAITVDLDGLTSLANIAAALQTSVRAADGNVYAAATVTAVGTAFLVTGTAALSLGTGFDDTAAARTLGLAGPGAALIANIEDPETPSDALTRIADIDCSFFWVSPESGIVQDDTLATSVRTWVAAQPDFTFGVLFDLFGAGVLVANESASLGARLSALRGNGIGGIYNGRRASDLDHKGLSYMGRFSSINFDAPNAVPNGKFLQLPGTTPTELTTAERAELRRKRINYYIPVGGGNDADTEEGQTFQTWIDVFVWVAWFKNAVEVAGYNFLKQSSPLGGVPLTDPGLASVADAIEDVCERGVRNGGIAPNEVSAPFKAAIQRATGNREFNGFLSSGYLVVRPRASQITQDQRNARGRIPVSVYLKGSGKLNNLEIIIDFEN